MPGWKRCRWESLQPITAWNSVCTTSRVRSPGRRRRRQILGLEPRSSIVSVSRLGSSGGGTNSITRLREPRSGSDPRLLVNAPLVTCCANAMSSSLLRLATQAFRAAGSVGTGRNSLTEPVNQNGRPLYYGGRRRKDSRRTARVPMAVSAGSEALGRWARCQPTRRGSNGLTGDLGDEVEPLPRWSAERWPNSTVTSMRSLGMGHGAGRTR